MNQDQCISCNGSKSIYGHMCSDCRLLINGYNKDTVQTKSEQALKRPKRRKKQNIFSTLDILISVFVVTPLVVACWRGTWQLIDVYGDYFPPWESFLIGTTIHIIIGISQESFHEILNRKYSSWFLNVGVFILMKMYTIIFNAVTNMYWRGSWIIIDEYFGITITEAGKAEVENGQGAFAFFTICLLIMFFMKSLRNLNSPPFELCLDYGDDMFLFPNMFKVKFTLFAAVSTKLRIKKLEELENSNLSIISPKPLGLRFTDTSKDHPRPFQISFHGQQPTVFSVTSSTNGYSLQIKALSEKLKDYPRSIEEIIEYNASKETINRNQYRSTSFSLRDLLGNFSYTENVSRGFKKVDSFQEHKPLHPGEINLLAMRSFRFAPPAWEGYSSKYLVDTVTRQFKPSKEEPFKFSKANLYMD